MFSGDKSTLVKYLLKRDSNIKEVDYAIPLNYAKKLRELDINTAFYISVYYKNGHSDIINILDELIKFYSMIMLDFIHPTQNMSDVELIKFHNLDDLEYKYINLMIET